MSGKRDSASDSAFPRDWIGQAMGGVSVPGNLDDFAESLERQQPGALRLRRGVAATSLPFPSSPVAWYKMGHWPVDPECRPSRAIAYATADYYLQDAGSLLALAAAGADGDSLRDLLICDLCAAPGGKASALVEAVTHAFPSEGGFVLANEVIGSRLGALKLNLARTGSDRYAISNLDPDRLAEELPGVFDVVLVDAPCSGQALLGRGKQRVAALSARQVSHSASRQHRILDAAVRLLRDGGKLVYSTCTFAEAENETQVARLIDRGVAQPDPITSLSPYSSSGESCYRLWPHIHRCAGSFAASMIVTAGNQERLRHGGKRSDPGQRGASLPDEVSQWFGDWDGSVRPYQLDSVILGWPAGAPDWVERVAVGGPELAHRTGKTWKPSHAAALRTVQRGEAVGTTDVDEETARAFLRGESIPCAETGWCVVRLGGRPLGWIKANGSVGKNHLPPAARMPHVS